MLYLFFEFWKFDKYQLYVVAIRYKLIFFYNFKLTLILGKLVKHDKVGNSEGYNGI